MSCREFESYIRPYLDGELPADETAAAEEHLRDCAACAALAWREREFRRLLRRQRCEPAPPGLRIRILAGVQACRRRAALRPVVLFAVAATVTAAVAAALLLRVSPSGTLIMAELVDKHLVFAQVQQPAEFASAAPSEIHDWLLERARLRVAVPDFSPAGIRLVGARLTDVHEREAAYLLYEKGMTALSVFIVPSAAERSLTGASVSYRGHTYITSEWKGQRTVAWTDGPTLYGLVSMLHYDALFECADLLRTSGHRDP